MTILHYACKMHNWHHHSFHCVVKASIFALYRQASPMTSCVEEVSTDPLESLKAVSHWKRLHSQNSTTCSGLLKTALSNVLLPKLFNVVNNIVQDC